MTLSLPYGSTRVYLDMDWARYLGCLTPRVEGRFASPSDSLTAGLQHPIGLDSPIGVRLARGGRMTIVLSDAFRRTGIDQLLPTFVDYVLSHGIEESDIRFLFATGVHRAPTPEEQERIVGAALYQRFKSQMLVHDAGDAASLVYVGTTRRGTPVWINRHAYTCEHLVLTGTVVFHYFAGFGGGAKGIGTRCGRSGNHRVQSPSESSPDRAMHRPCSTYWCIGWKSGCGGPAGSGTFVPAGAYHQHSA